MARIRTIKPEFWDSPSVAKASPWARLLFIAMWNWADDHGRGTANLKELEGFAFPNDDRFTDSSGNTVHFRSLVAEVVECFGVVFYEAENRPYYEIPTWDSHQRNERRAKESKYPAPPVITRKKRVVAEIPCIDTEIPRISVSGTGEQGNRGTGEQGKKLSNDPKETQIEVAAGILMRTINPELDTFTASVAIDLITEPATEPIRDLPAYITAAIDKSHDRVVGLCREAERQVERMRA